MQRIIVFCLLVLTSSASAQSLSVFDLDATNFPTIKAKFYAFDAAGNEQHPSPSQIGVSENGMQRTVTSITCPPATSPQAFSSVLVMDVSSSMGSGSDNVTNMNIAKAAATFWTNNIPLGPSECAVSSFDDNSYFNQDFTISRKKLANAIAGLAPQNGTNYDAGFLLPVAGGLEITKLGKHQKIIIFLTDGLPNFEPQTASIIAEAQSQGCLIFSVTVGLPCPQCLKDISGQTGGAWYENIISEQEIEDVYRHIMQQAQGDSPCEITWQSNVSCVAGTTDVQFKWSGVSALQSYLPPASSVASLPITPPSLYIRSKLVGVRFDTIVTITAINSAFTVTSITSTNPSFDINAKSFSLSAGESKQLTVSYTPFDSNYTWAQFDIATNLCPQIYYASASYPGYRPTIPTLKLTLPNGGEQLLVGSDTMITWKGIPATDTVRLEYSTDDGSSWRFIADKATGGRYAWHVPKTVSDRCLLKADQLMAHQENNWVRNPGVDNSDLQGGKGITTDVYGNSYVTGAFSGVANFGGVTLSARGAEDIFLVKYRSDGSVEWAERAGGLGDYESGNSIATDLYDNVFVTGHCGPMSDFSGDTVAEGGFFIAKYFNDGSLAWVRTAPNGDGRGLAVDGEGHIFATGAYRQEYTQFGSIPLRGTAGDHELFLVRYDTDGDAIWAISGSGWLWDYGQSISVDTADNIYITGYFNFEMKLDTNTLNTVGVFDNSFLAKYHLDGSLEWVKTVKGRGNGNNSNAITVDNEGNVYIAGSFSDTVDFGGGHIICTKEGNFFIAKYHNDGTCEWATSASSSNGYGLAVDRAGNIYVTGLFNSSLTNFGGITLKGRLGSQYVFLAKYAPNGLTDWAISTSNGGFSNKGLGVAVDPIGNIFVTGDFEDSSIFVSDTMRRTGFNFFIWKIGSDLLQSDTSDALFSIVMPVALSEDVDMGKVLVAAAKDSVIQSFVLNGGSYPFRVDSIAIVGVDASQFGLVSGIPPFVVPAGGAQHVEFDFHPSSAGVKSAQIAIFTQADTLFQNITGIGVQPTLAVMGNVIDFGQVNVGSFKDTTITVALQNLGNVPVVFTTSSELGPDKTQFTLQSGGAPFTLDPGKSQSVTLRFAPKFIGRTSGRIGFEYGGNSPAILTVFGQGLGGLVSIFDDSGYAGDHKHIPMILGKVPVTSVQSEATNFSARIAYDRTVLYPSSGSVQHGARFDTVTVSGSIGGDSILANLPFTA
ncbi:MAG: SBBP repeat-containing protein, partial [Bacteroidota bacterium]|nr:SBBP repeat-containing protein [Bacteroidota bacterium]